MGSLYEVKGIGYPDTCRAGAEARWRYSSTVLHLGARRGWGGSLYKVGKLIYHNFPTRVPQKRVGVRREIVE
jgi:hypothetical protein